MNCDGLVCDAACENEAFLLHNQILNCYGMLFLCNVCHNYPQLDSS